MKTNDLSHIRKEFPSLNLNINGNRAIFFDGPGGTQLPRCVVKAMTEYLENWNANIGGPFKTSMVTEKKISEARLAMADFIGCQSEEIYFGQSASILLLQLAISLSLSCKLNKGDEVLITQLDHEANRAPWEILKQQMGIVIKEIKIDTNTCTIDMEDLDNKITDKTAVIAMNYANNALGIISNVKKIISKAKKVDAITVVDAVHYAPHGVLDVKDLDVDFLVCSTYKFFGPHYGILYGKEDTCSKIEGFGEASTNYTNRMETGTKNHEAIASLPSLIDFIANIKKEENGSRRKRVVKSLKDIRDYEERLFDFLYQELSNIKSINLYGPPLGTHPRTPTISFTVKGKRPKKVSEELGKMGIFVYYGHFYSTRLIEVLGLLEDGGLVRVGLAPYNTKKEVVRLIDGLDSIN